MPSLTFLGTEHNPGRTMQVSGWAPRATAHQVARLFLLAPAVVGGAPRPPGVTLGAKGFLAHVPLSSSGLL